MSGSNFVKLCTAALAGSILGIAYERMPPSSDWPVLIQTVMASASIVPRNNQLTDENTPTSYKVVDVIDPIASGENLKHSARFGLPSRDNLRLFNNFILSYDRRLRAPAWVFEHLTPEKLTVQNANRAKSKFHEDAALHDFFRAKNADFANSGFDRGHMAAAGNHKLNQDVMDQTFSLSNISPQVPEVNQGPWERLETYVRWRAKRSKNLYVVTGPLYLPMKARDGNFYVTYRVLGNNHISVPTHYFKVFLIETKDDKYEIEAFVMPNDPKLSSETKFQEYRLPINRLDTVERAAGIIFFDQLSRDKLLTPTSLPEDFKEDFRPNHRKKLTS